jgi:FMN reductase
LSRSASLVNAIVDHVAEMTPIDCHRLELGKIAPGFGGIVSAKEASVELARELNAIETADVLVVGSPVYRGSYPGLFKHLFDLIHQESLIGVPVILSATGGSERHALVIEHQLRPLFAFFQALTLPVGVFATDADFANYEINSEMLKSRIALAVERARPFLRPRPEAIFQAA